MRDIKDIVYEHIGYTKKISISDVSQELQKVSGIKRLLRKIAFKLTWWIIEPVVLNFNHQVDLNLNFYHYLVHLENMPMDYENYKKRALNDYKQYIAHNEPTNFELKYQRGYRFDRQPLISMVLFVKGTNTDYLKDVINSIRAQTYDNWELHIVTYCKDIETKAKKLYGMDKQIKCCLLDKPRTDEAVLDFVIRQTQGEYVCFINQYDTIAPFTLHEVVKIINEHTDAGLIYGDYDKIKDFVRFKPAFRPNFAPDTLRSTNYIGDFYFIKSCLLKEIAEHMEYNGDMHYEVILRAVELTNEIYRIPKILKNKRYPEASKLKETDLKAGINADVIKSHIDRKLKLKSTVEYIGVSDIYRVDYEVVDNPGVSILIPNKDSIKFLKPCVESILKNTTYDNYEIVIIENNSLEKETFVYYEELEKSDRIRVIKFPDTPDTRFNYQKIINFGVKNCENDYIMQLNNDMELITPNWLELMLGFAQRDDIGAVGAKLYYPDKSLQHAGGMLTGSDAICDHIFRFMPKNAHSYENRDLWIQNISWVTGACLLSKREIYEQVGFMSEEYEKSFGDVDFCMKIRGLGKKIVYQAFVELIHYEGKTRGLCETSEEVDEFIKEREMFRIKWMDEIKRGDPYNDASMDKVFFDSE